MSGIAALVSYAGPPVCRRHVDAMASQMRDRGPEGSGAWARASGGLGHTRLTTTPQAVHEIQPFVDSGSGLAVVADARLDNRTDLIGLLGLAPEMESRLGDAELILRCYLRWGEGCPIRLLGDFAFAVWDESRHQLFCARDHLGVKPLYYHHSPGRLFALASNARSLLGLEDIPYRINEARIADFLVDALEGIDKTSTFFEGIYRLPPAHSLTVTPAGMRQARYWTLEPGPTLKLSSDAAYVDAFLEVFEPAVDCRLASEDTTGSMLSGGMDSGAIVAVARALRAKSGGGPLRTFSAVAGASENCVESQAIAAAQTMDGLSPYTVSPRSWNDLRPELDNLSWASEEPFDIHMTLLRALYLAAHREGFTALLDGIDGDNVMSEGSQLRCLLRRGRWIAAWREAAGLEGFWGGQRTTGQLLSSAAKSAFVPAPARHLFRRTRERAFGDLLDEQLGDSIISSSLASRVGVADRLRALDATATQGGRWRGLAWERVQALDSPYLTVGLERYDRVASSVSIEPRHPFLDLRVIAFFLALPGDQKLAHGWPKALLRRAMGGRLPDEVRWRRGKQHLGWTFTAALLGPSTQRVERIIDDDRELLADFVDVAGTLRGSSTVTEQGVSAAALGAWIRRQNSSRPHSLLPSA